MSTQPPELLAQHTAFGGTVGFYRHHALTCNALMRFAIYQPRQVQTQRLPVLYFLAGLTCTEENFMVKAGAQRFAAQYGLVLVVPDTSPRQTGTPGEDTDWDLGTGAGFYVNATVEPWSRHYQMYSYVVEELPALIQAHFSVGDRRGIFGHSMGGQGALVCALRNPNHYQSVSAFAPICAPTRCPWGQKAFGAYLGTDDGSAYDATQLLAQHQFPALILVDQGTADPYLLSQLQPERLAQACALVDQPLLLRYQEGYDHSYYFIATFIEDHLRHHAALLTS
ncbi:S-formylglutathione hydrolase [Candidatus Cyanaurora vandensis]|uniref:S-formylglutathione hydrolase n=1 Tax=Candidatus Cyanaurora vandensis TaxID=2714958 RepID=UPI00257A95D3|nr:S-formylglutathione hydrolase [Candidatus Cyanaurora vandensis]